ncbi:g5647 [Coccomyxa elongata]
MNMPKAERVYNKAANDNRKVAGRTTEPPGREILRGELRGHVWWAARTGGRGQYFGVGGTPHRPCPAVLCGSLDRWYRATGAPFRAGVGRRVYAGVECEVNGRKQD